MLDDAVLSYGAFVDSEVDRYQYHRRPRSASSSDTSDDAPTPEEVSEYRRALIEGTPFNRRSVMRRRPMQRLPGLKRPTSDHAEQRSAQ